MRLLFFKAKFFFCSLLFFTAPLFSQNAPREPKKYTSEQLRKTVAVAAADFNSDESKVLMSSNETGIFNSYEITIANKNSVALTQSKSDAFRAINYIKGSNNFIYFADKGGNENDHLYLFTSNSSTSKDITPWAKSKNNFAGWSKDNQSIYVGSNKRNPKYFDIWKLDTATWQPKLLFQNDSAYDVSDISESERFISLSKSITTNKNELYIFEAATKTMKRLSNDNESIWNSMAFEKNDNTFYYSTNDGSEFQYLVKYNILTGAKEKFFETKWDIAGFNLSKNEKYHTISINEDGKNKILLFDHATNTPISFPDIDGGDVSSLIFSDSENNLLLTVGSSTSPSNLYVYNLSTKKLTRLTNTLNPEIAESDLSKASVIRFKSFDGLEIPAIYYKPLQASKTNKVGALVWVHGGPGGQSRVGYSNSIQYLVNHGYAVLAVNNRGSSGYGKTFFKLDDKDHGYGDLNDCIWAKKWLSQQDYIDANAIGIYGGSYGGNMVLNAMALKPDEFKVGVDLFGVTNWMRTLKSIPPYWESFRKALYVEMGDPFTKDSVLLKNTSPLFNYKTIKKPLIVFQGANDVRVLPIESDEIVEGVKKNGVPVEYYVYPEEGHGFQKKENLITTDNKTLQFLDKYLKPKN